MPAPARRSLNLLRTALRPEPAAIAAVSLGVLAVGTWVAPQALRAIEPAPPEIGEATVEGDVPPERAPVVEGLREILERSYAYVGARNADGEGPFAMTLWQSDPHRRGELNAAEAILLTHSAVLATVTASYLEEGGEDERLDLGALLGPEALRRFRSSGPLASRVIATGVTALSVSAEPAGPGVVKLELTLTWATDPDESRVEAAASRTTLAVHMRRVEGVGR